MELQDRISGPAKTIAQSLGQAEEATKSFGTSITSIAEGVGLERLGEKVIDLGREFAGQVIEANRFATETKIAFGVLYGSAEKGNDVFEQTRRFAINAGIEVSHVADSFKALKLAGVAEANVEPIVNAAADLAALGPKGVGLESYVQAFADIQSKGDLAGRSLAQFKGIIDFDALGKKLGFATHGYEQLAKTLTQTPVSADRAIKALVSTLADKTGGISGSVAQKLGNTFGGTITSIREELISLFEFDSSNSPILELLHTLRDSLKEGSPLLENIKAGARSFMDGLGLTLGDNSGFKPFLQSIKDGTLLGAGFRDAMGAVGATLATVADLLGKVVKGYDLLIHGVDWGLLKEQIMQFTPEGIVSGIVSRGVSQFSSVAGAVSGGGVKAFAEGGHVDGPTFAMVGEGGEGESIVPDSKLGSVGNRSANLHVEQHFHINGAGGVEASDLARHLHALSLGDLQGALDTLAQQMGAA